MGDPSFPRLVFLKALKNTVAVFRSRLRDAAYVFLSLVTGGAIYYAIWGLPRAMSEALPIVIFSFAPLGIFVFCVFLWHLAIAPAELLYETIKESTPVPSSAPAASPARVKPAVMWSIWKQMDDYTLKQFAAILARDDPIDMSYPHDQAAYLKLLDSDVRSGKLPYIKEILRNFHDDPYEREINEKPHIRKADAIKWADAHEGFDVIHIR
jgi:hypothetical protein